METCWLDCGHRRGDRLVDGARPAARGGEAPPAEVLLCPGISAIRRQPGARKGRERREVTKISRWIPGCHRGLDTDVSRGLNIGVV